MTTELQERCRHKDFIVDATVNRLEDVQAFMLDIRVKCSECRLPFTFPGIKAGLSAEKPMASVDGQELHIRIAPKDSRIFPAIPGFEERTQ
jgi:hypothetical protein